MRESPQLCALIRRFSDIECPADCVAAIYNVLSRRLWMLKHSNFQSEARKVRERERESRSERDGHPSVRAVDWGTALLATYP